METRCANGRYRGRSWSPLLPSLVHFVVRSGTECEWRCIARQLIVVVGGARSALSPSQCVVRVSVRRGPVRCRSATNAGASALGSGFTWCVDPRTATAASHRSHPRLRDGRSIRRLRDGCSVTDATTTVVRQ